MIRAGYRLLGLQTYFTAGPKEIRAWTMQRGATAPEAAGVIHTRLRAGLHPRRGDRVRRLLRGNGEQGAKKAGQLRIEGKEYVVQDGDVMHFRFNV